MTWSSLKSLASPRLMWKYGRGARKEVRSACGGTQEAAQESFPDDLDQTTQFDHAEPEPVPDDDFDQSWEG